MDGLDPIMRWTASRHTLRKKYFQSPFLVLQLVTNRGLLYQYLEEPNGTTEAHNRNIGVQMDLVNFVLPIASISITVLPDTIWPFQVESSACDKLKHQKR